MRSNPVQRYYADNDVILLIQHPENWRDNQPINGDELGAILDEYPTLKELLVGVEFSAASKGIGFTPPPPSEEYQAEAVPPSKTLSTTLKLPWNGENVGEFTSQLNQYLANPDNSAVRAFKDGANLTAVIPNHYLSGSSHESSGTHGPGRVARPALYSNARLAGMTIDTGAANQSTGACDIDIYILDTIPPIDRLSGAYDKNADWHEALEPYNLILVETPQDDPLNPEPFLYHTARASYFYAEGLISGEKLSDFLTVEHHHCPGADHSHDPLVLHRMRQGEGEPVYIAHGETSDHGLFIASLIHKIVPDTPLFVIQVLNDYGIGTIWSLIAGFKKVAELQKKNGLNRNSLINCSFTVSISAPDETHAIDALYSAMRACLYTGNVGIVAAAGNDSTRQVTDGTSKAGYPANLSFVVGVGALNKSENAASYSNTADNPAAQGFMVFGGDYEETLYNNDIYGDPDQFEDRGNGVIGVYTGDFIGNVLVNDECTPPEIVTNQNGYAEWAGTSFATPIVCAILAKLMCEPTLLDAKIAEIQADALARKKVSGELMGTSPRVTVTPGTTTGTPGTVVDTSSTAAGGAAIQNKPTETKEPEVDEAIVKVFKVSSLDMITRERKFKGVRQNL